LAEKYKIIAIDNNITRIKELKKSKDTNGDISEKKIFKANKNIEYYDNYSKLKFSNIIIVTLPTPVNKKKEPDLTIIKIALKKIAIFLNKNDIVIFESTVFPGATEKVFAPILEKYSNLVFNKDFFCGYSPERINPGDKKNTIEKINKIVSGSSKKALEIIYDLYSSIIKAKIYKVRKIEIAEAAKVIENCQRDINVAFMNELSLIFNKLQINTNEVLKAASTKWNFLNFKPGLVGGHCIGIDPYYLTYIAKKNSYNPKIILSGRYLNDNIGKFICEKIYSKFLKSNMKSKTVLLLGYTFKENCSDIRNTKVEDIYKYFKNKKFITKIYDPLAKKNDLEKNNKILKDFITKPRLKYYSIIIICVNHNYFKKIGFKNIKLFSKKDSIIFDIKNTFPNKNIMYL